jgi:flagellar motor switch protein FliN/FliY
MNDGFLSQDEINALLTNDVDGTRPAAEDSAAILTDFEKDALGEIGNISMGTSATTLSTLLGKKVQITTPQVQVVSRRDMSDEHPFPYVVIEVAYTEGISGVNALYVSERDAAIIADLMMGNDGHVSNVELDDIKLSAVSEAMNQMIGSATTSMSSMFAKRIDISPPTVKVVDLSEELTDVNYGDDMVVNIRFRMIIEGLIDSEILQIVQPDAAKSMVKLLVGAQALSETALEAAQASVAAAGPSAVSQPASPAAAEPAAASPQEPAPQQIPPQPQPVYPPPMYAQPQPVYPPQPGVTPNYNYNPYMAGPSAFRPTEAMPVQPVQFMELSSGGDLNLTQSISLILDIPLDVSVQLGKTSKTIKEVLELTEGSIIQLDKLAGEAVELLVNGKLIARGEVVVIDENYGIRITSILSPMDRMEKIQ